MQSRAIIAANNPAELYEGGSDDLDVYFANRDPHDVVNQGIYLHSDEAYSKLIEKGKTLREALSTAE